MITPMCFITLFLFLATSIYETLTNPTFWIVAVVIIVVLVIIGIVTGKKK